MINAWKSGCSGPPTTLGSALVDVDRDARDGGRDDGIDAPVVLLFRFRLQRAFGHPTAPLQRRCPSRSAEIRRGNFFSAAYILIYGLISSSLHLSSSSLLFFSPLLLSSSSLLSKVLSSFSHSNPVIVPSFTFTFGYSVFQETCQNYALYRGFHYCQHINNCENAS